MNTVKKFDTFDELKSCENKTMNHATILKKHNKLKKVITEIKSIKNSQSAQTEPE